MKNTTLIINTLLLIIACGTPPEIKTKTPAPIIKVSEQIIVVEIPPLCPSDMIQVKGNYCTKLEPKCRVWLDSSATKERFRRCLTYEDNICKSKQIPLDFCIDTYEHPEKDSKLPMSDISWTEALKICESEGKRLCSDEEWTFACEGPNMLVHPYGNTRNQEICYHDKVLKEMVSSSGFLIDLREDIYTHPQCTSPFGVKNMVGNVGEWVYYEEGGKGFRSGGKGGWWNSGLRSRCRPITVGHDEDFKQVQIGFRCCKDY